MKILLNGEERELERPMDLAEVVEMAGGDPERRGMAAALEGEVIPRSQWRQTRVPEGAEVEVVAAIQGGSGEWQLGGRQWGSRLIAGSGGFRSLEAMESALEISGTEIITVALRPAVVFSGETRPDAAAIDALHHRAHEACYIANSIRADVTIEAR